MLVSSFSLVHFDLLLKHQILVVKLCCPLQTFRSLCPGCNVFVMINLFFWISVNSKWKTSLVRCEVQMKVSVLCMTESVKLTNGLQGVSSRYLSLLCFKQCISGTFAVTTAQAWCFWLCACLAKTSSSEILSLVLINCYCGAWHVRNLNHLQFATRTRKKIAAALQL